MSRVAKFILSLEQIENEDKMATSYVIDGSHNEIVDMLSSIMISHPELIRLVAEAGIKAQLKLNQLVRDN